MVLGPYCMPWAIVEAQVDFGLNLFLIFSLLITMDFRISLHVLRLIPWDLGVNSRVITPMSSRRLEPITSRYLTLEFYAI